MYNKEYTIQKAGADMIDSYTQAAREYIFDLLDKDTAAIWDDIETTPQDTPAELWRKKLTRIARNYAYSSRFALMRILCSRATGCKITEEGRTRISSGSNFEMRLGNKTYAFHDISMPHAENLTPEEHLAYLDCLLDIAGMQPDSDPEEDRQIICRAWYDIDSANTVSEYLLPQDIRGNERKLKKARGVYTKENQKYKNRLTKEEVFQLGHILKFSLVEMQWFLLRTLDVAEGFRFNHSTDLIEAYGLLTNAGRQHVQTLRARYTEATRDVKKATHLPQSNRWSRNVSDFLPEKVEMWKKHPTSMDDEFLQWMVSIAPALDVPSTAATQIYRNLAAFAHDLITGEEITPNEEEFADCIQDVFTETKDSGAVHRLFYENGHLSVPCCKKVANVLLLENKVQSVSIQEDNTKAWHVLSTLSDGTLTSAGGTINSGRTRVADILAGKVQVEKSDMLYLLWFIANLIWQSSDIPDANAICCRVIDFMDTAKYLLDAALLPEFYPPHPVEQSMLLSIVSGRSEDDSPSVVYEYMLHALIRQRQRKQGSKRHDAAFIREVVTYYRSHPELTLEECAQQFDISPKTLSAWQKQLLDSDPSFV